MKTKAHTRAIALVGLATALVAVALPTTALARPTYDAGAVARTLGSPDPREAATKTNYPAGVVASRLGSPDPRDTGLASFDSGTVATVLGSPDPHDAAIVAQSGVPATNSGFHWRDFGIGAGFGVGLSAILAGSVVFAGLAVRGRSVAQPLS